MTTTIQPSRLKNPVQVAWGVLLLAFAVFCTIALFTLLAVHYFFFLSTVPMDASVSSVRGGVNYRPLDSSELAVGDAAQVLNVCYSVEPNPQSQGIVTFRDPYRNGQVVATLSLNDSDSALTLRYAVRPRYDWGNADFLIEVEDVQGELEVYVADGYDSSNFLMVMQTTQGASIRLSSSGKATVRVVGTRTEVMNDRGEMVLIDPTFGAKSIPQGYLGRVLAGQSGIEVLQSPLVNLIENNTFSEVLLTGEGATRSSFPDIWRCSNAPGSAPSGAISTSNEEGRQSLKLVRGPTETHGETFCEQGVIPSEEVSPNWVDLSSYDYLSLKTSFFINFQSLNRCGQDASECPLMVRIDFVGTPFSPEDADPQIYSQYYGFYALNNPQQQPDYPFQCQSCRQEHIRIREKQWYTYTSGNILPTLPFNPQYITSVRLYASGHQYDVRVSEFSLFAGMVNTSAAVPADASQTQSVGQ